MGGLGSGGHPNVGPKPKSREERWLDGNAGKRGGKPRRKVPPAEPVEMPTDLSDEVRAMWLELEPLARTALTLTKSTALAFRDLCEALVLKRQLLAQVREEGFTFLKVTVDGSGQEHQEPKAHPLLARHQGMMQRCEAGLMRFRLSPVGKEIIPDPEPEDPFAEFDGADVQ